MLEVLYRIVKNDVRSGVREWTKLKLLVAMVERSVKVTGPVDQTVSSAVVGRVKV